MKSDRERLLAKIRKLLALAQSSNPNKAAVAMRQAQKLMAELNINQVEVEISEAKSKKSFANKTPEYIHLLAATIKTAFGVEGYFESGLKTQAVFYGQGERPEIASYCFDVLYRQLDKARAEFNAMQNPRLKRSTRINRADLFCEGWVVGVYQAVKEFAPQLSAEEKGKLERYHQHLHSKHRFADAEVREAKSTGRSSSDEAKRLGYQRGKDVELYHGVNGKERGKLGYRGKYVE